MHALTRSPAIPGVRLSCRGMRYYVRIKPIRDSFFAFFERVGLARQALINYIDKTIFLPSLRQRRLDESG